MSDCPKCGEWVSGILPHRCQPLWHAWEPDQAEREDALTIRACDAQAAAREYGERHDAQGDYSIVQGSEAMVLVARQGSASAEAFMVTGESVPKYSACPVREASS